MTAFEAIRRAATIARYHDTRANYHRDTITTNADSGKFVNDDDSLIAIETSANSLWHHTECAASIRNAIRAAIGSEKP
jgi:hypothetical protein